MPTYQYACTACDERLEVVQKFHDEPLTVCPSCEGPLRKVFSAVGVVFKGSGFYRTDSRSGSGASTKNSSAGDKASTSDTKQEKKAEATPAKSESKPAAKSSGDSKVA